MECVWTKRQRGGGGLKTELGGSSDAGYVWVWVWSVFWQNDNEEEVWTNTELARLLPLAPRKCASAVVAPRSNAFISSSLLTLLLLLLLLLPTEEHCWRSWSRNFGVNCILAADALEGQSRCNNLTMLWTKFQWSPGWLVLSWSLWSLLCANSLLCVYFAWRQLLQLSLV